jgi:hypothetical protein
MTRIFRVVIVATAIFTSAQRLPAPIVEQESPTPTPQQSASPKRKQTKAREETSNTSSHRQTPSPPVKNQPSPTTPQFGGSWTGHFKVTGVLLMASEDTFVISPLQKSLQWIVNQGGSDHTAVALGNSISWKSGSFSEINCKLTMHSDGRTADIRMTSMWGSASGTVIRQ